MATSNLFLLNYNQYFNKIVKIEKNLDDYRPYVRYSSENYKLSGTAFNPGDGVLTEHVVNTPDANFDYLIVTNELDEIESRWFVIDATYLRGNGVRVTAQYNLSLRRDLFADYFDEITNADCFIEKATLQSISNPLIYNSEGFNTNQIKTNELLLTDATKTPWVICYLDKKYATDEEQYILSTVSGHDTQFSFSLTELRNLGTMYGAIQSDVNTIFRTSEKIGTTNTNQTIEYNSNNTWAEKPYADYNIKRTDVLALGSATSVRNETAAQFSQKMATHAEAFKSQFYNYRSHGDQTSLIYELQRMAGHLIKDTDLEDNYFTFDMEFANNVYIDAALPSGSELYNLALNEVLSIPGLSSGSGTNGFAINTKVQTAIVKDISVASGEQTRLIIPKAETRQHTIDAPFDMLAIPMFEGVKFKYSGGEYTTSANIAVNMAQAIATAGGSFVYDIQLLPYCPCMEYWSDTLDMFDLTYFKLDQHFSIIRHLDATPFSIAFWCNKSNFRSLVDFEPINVSNNPTEFKIANECDKYRLISPNYNGGFEFSITKNNGLFGFEINSSYKPQQPYIHVNPIFSGLYGKDFNDERGLVCGGDFSLPRVNDAWNDYQIQNKAYRDSFDRQIQNMETTYSIDREQMRLAGLINVGTSAISGIASGAKSGAMIGGPVGGVVGGVVGGAASAGLSAYGLHKDLEFNERRHQEDVSYSTDMFNFNLRNIQALPHTLSRVGAFDINSKFFPFLEYYTCTDIEKEALRKKLIYNGMTIMTIGKIADYLNEEENFIQGQLIRIDIDEDYHIVNSIASDIKRGVYIKGGA